MAIPALLPVMPASPDADRRRLAEAIDAALPQTQCRRCGYADCRAYAEAIAWDGAAIDRCPPGGAVGIERLAAITGRAARALDPACGVEAPRTLVRIDEAACIGCRICLAACPVDAIVGGPKAMHVVIASACTGCELCVPACPVDCITLAASTGTTTGWAAWTPEQADTARARYARHRERLEPGARSPVGQRAPAPPLQDAAERRDPPDPDPSTAGPVSPAPAAVALGVQTRVQAALARARARVNGDGTV